MIMLVEQGFVSPVEWRAATLSAVPVIVKPAEGVLQVLA